MKKAAYYFSHDANARSDSKIMQLRSVYGLKGYGAYWVVIELLKEAGGFLDIKSKYAAQGLALEMDQSKSFIINFLNDCVEEFGLFELDESGRLFSPSLLGRIEQYEAIVQKRKDAASKRWAGSEQKQCKSNAIKQNKIKLNKSKIFKEPTPEQIEQHFQEKAPSLDIKTEAEKFYNFYASKGWMVGRNKMKSWQAAANNWIARNKKENTNGKEKRSEQLQQRAGRPVGITI
tara:strand:+ start:886 stop:1581 length:696 start_codon:yes stop_codon:yes gene_type:complete